MKKRLTFLVMLCLVLITTACGNEKNSDCKCECSCGECVCSGEQEKHSEGVVEATDVFGKDVVFSETKTREEETKNENPTVSITQEPTEELTEEPTEGPTVEPVTFSLTEGEKASRKQLQQQLYAEREKLYLLPDSLTKTMQINEIDKMIIENTCIDFSQKTLCFVGDSITYGVGGLDNGDGTKRSYVDYIVKNLNVGEYYKNGKVGRMFASYGDDSYSLKCTLEENVYLFSDAIVLFLGVNDYLAEVDNKRYGEQDVNSYSDAGFCGSVRTVAKFFKNNMSDMPVFVVTTYDLDYKNSSTFSDMPVPPTYSDYMNKLKEIAEHYGMHIIDLYNTGFMDCRDLETKNKFLADIVHPNDEGYKLLSDHIAAELVYYFSQK